MNRTKQAPKDEKPLFDQPLPARVVELARIVRMKNRRRRDVAYWRWAAYIAAHETINLAGAPMLRTETFGARKGYIRQEAAERFKLEPLSEADILAIRNSDEDQGVLASRFNRSRTNICKIQCGRSYRQFGGRIRKPGDLYLRNGTPAPVKLNESYAGAKNGRAKLDDARVVALRAFVGSHSDAARAFGISRSQASAIRRGISWNESA